MKRQRQYWFCILMLAIEMPSSAQEAAHQEELVQAVHKVADLSLAGPYVLTANIVLSSGDAKRKQTGRLTIQRDHDRARVELQIGDYHELRIGVGDKAYFPEGSSLLFPTHLDQFDRSWDPTQQSRLHTLDKVTFGGLSKKTIHGHKGECFERRKGVEKSSLCIDPGRSVLLRVRAGHNRSFEFYDYTAVGEQMFPRRVEIKDPVITAIELRDVSVSFHPVDAAQFAIPDHAIEVETCQGFQFPNPVFTPEPSYTERARSKSIQGTVLLYALISNQGAVTNPRILKQVDPDLDASAQRTVQRWKFKPGVCAGHPVATEMLLEVDFRLH